MRSSRPRWIWFLALAGCGVTPHGVPVDGGGGGNNDLPFNFDFGGMVCSPSDPPACDGDAIKTCRSDGSGYDFTPCTVGCANGACTCAPGDTVCMGQDVMKCDMNGVYQKLQTCGAGTQCQMGACTDARCDDELMSTNPHALPTNAWPRFRHDNRNTGSTPTVVADMPKLKWKAGPFGTHQLNSQLCGMASGPVVNQNNVVFVGAGDGDNQNGSLWALDAMGKQLWVFKGNRGFGYTTPAVRLDGTSYFSSADGNAYAVDPNGVQVWKFSFGFQDDSSPIVTKDGIVIYGSDTRELFAMDFAGALQWKSDMNAGPGEVDAALAETCDGKVIAAGTNGFTALDAKTGMTLWRVNVNGLMSSPLVTADGTVYGFATSSATALAIDPMGKVLWQVQVGPGGAGTSMAKVGGQVFVVANDGKLHALDAATGKENWSQPVGQLTEIYKHGGPVVDGKQRLYFNSNDGNLYSFDTTGKQLWKIPSSGVAAPNGNSFGEMAIGNDGTLYVPGNDGELYAFQ